MSLPNSSSSVVLERARRSLEQLLGPELLTLLRAPTTTELMLNPDGTLWVEQHGAPLRQVGVMRPEAGRAVLETVAGCHEREVTAELPVLECRWPLDNTSRFAGQFPPIVLAASFQIRKHTFQVIPLERYVETGVMSQAHYTAITGAVRAHRNLFISGGTGSGKTTLANAVIKDMVEAFPHERFVTIEDTGELQCLARNKTPLYSTTWASMRDLVKASLRMRPDRIVVGETRGPDALDLLIAMNTGHEGGLTTVHANGSRAALTRLLMLVSMHPDSPRPIEPLIGETAPFIVHLAKTPVGRRVQDVLDVTGYSNGAYLTTPL
jgi:P-type conjugative transfer ATPase TrbB